MKQLLSLCGILFLFLVVALGFWAGQTWSDASAQESRTYGPGWANIVHTGDTDSPHDALETTGDSVAAVYYLDNATGAWLRYFPARSEVSNLTTMVGGEPYLMLLTEDVTVTGSACDTSPPQDCPSPEADRDECQSDLGACQSDLGTCQSDLGACESGLGACESDLSASQSDLGACESGLGACESNLSTCTEWQSQICGDMSNALEAGYGDDVFLGIFVSYCSAY
jgi:hypothetical protein